MQEEVEWCRSRYCGSAHVPSRSFLPQPLAFCPEAGDLPENGWGSVPGEIGLFLEEEEGIPWLVDGSEV